MLPPPAMLQSSAAAARSWQNRLARQPSLAPLSVRSDLRAYDADSAAPREEVLRNSIRAKSSFSPARSGQASIVSQCVGWVTGLHSWKHHSSVAAHALPPRKRAL